MEGPCLKKLFTAAREQFFGEKYTRGVLHEVANDYVMPRRERFTNTFTSNLNTDHLPQSQRNINLKIKA